MAYFYQIIVQYANKILKIGLLTPTSLDRNNKIILINENAKDMRHYKAQNLRAVYYWAKLNGYDSIWQPKKLIEM